jgi:hypothetical protein
VQGRPPECRLAVERSGRIVVHLAQDPSADRAEPAACALDRTESATGRPGASDDGSHP